MYSSSTTSPNQPYLISGLRAHIWSGMTLSKLLKSLHRRTTCRNRDGIGNDGGYSTDLRVCVQRPEKNSLPTCQASCVKILHNLLIANQKRSFAESSISNSCTVDQYQYTRGFADKLSGLHVKSSQVPPCSDERLLHLPRRPSGSIDIVSLSCPS